MLEATLHQVYLEAYLVNVASWAATLGWCCVKRLFEC